MNESLVLRDVLYVPNFRFDLISLSKLALQNSCFTICNVVVYVIQDFSCDWIR